TVDDTYTRITRDGRPVGYVFRYQFKVGETSYTGSSQFSQLPSPDLLTRVLYDPSNPANNKIVGSVYGNDGESQKMALYAAFITIFMVLAAIYAFLKYTFGKKENK